MLNRAHLDVCLVSQNGAKSGVGNAGCQSLNQGKWPLEVNALENQAVVFPGGQYLDAGLSSAVQTHAFQPGWLRERLLHLHGKTPPLKQPQQSLNSANIQGRPTETELCHSRRLLVTLFTTFAPKMWRKNSGVGQGDQGLGRTLAAGSIVIEVGLSRDGELDRPAYVAKLFETF